MSDVSRKVVPDMGSLDRERPVAYIVRKKEFFHRTGRECARRSVYRDTMTSMVAGYRQRNRKQRALS